VDEENISKTYQDDSSNLIKKMLKSDPEMFEGLKLIVESKGAWLVSKVRVVFNAHKVQIPPAGMFTLHGSMHLHKWVTCG
jgi:hypothetical protein